MNTVAFPMTVQGAEALRAELEHLKRHERRRIAEAIATARELGDLKENAEYHAAREQQSFVEGRIQSLEEKLSHARIIDVTTFENTGKVIFGATVTLLSDHNGDEPVQYRIVGEDEADLKCGKISCSAPLARALIGKFEGDDVEVQTPKGTVRYTIEKVAYV